MLMDISSPATIVLERGRQVQSIAEMSFRQFSNGHEAAEEEEEEAITPLNKRMKVGISAHGSLNCLVESQGESANPYDLVDPVNDRLYVLQRLLPHGSELDEEEVLQVAVDYVKALERQIQTFDKSEDAMSNSNNSNQSNSLGELPSTTERSALQKRGLCIVPISALAQVF